jgi:PAS domain S-box-containing protein
MREDFFAARNLVDSGECLPSEMTVEHLVAWFKDRPQVEYAAVVADGAVAGLASREAMNAALSQNHCAYAVLSKRPITRVMLEDVLIVEGGMPIQDVVNLLLARRPEGQDFYQDIIVHEGGQLLGLASVKKLVVRQMELILEQMAQMEKQKAFLSEKNRELFEATLQLREGKRELQSFFEGCSFPIVIFDREGLLVRANPRFLQMSGYASRELEARPHAKTLFTGGWNSMLEAYRAAEAFYGGRKPSYSLRITKRGGQEETLEVALDIDEEAGQTIVSVLRTIGHERAVVEKVMHDRIRDESEFVRNLVKNLVDRDIRIEEAEGKIEAIVGMARQMEAEARTGAGGSAGNMSGRLGEFSVIDLSQLLVHGNKTGELTLTGPEGSGVIYFEKGRFVHALCGELEGGEALRRMMRVDCGTFLFSPGVKPPKATIMSGGMEVLLEACREVDEHSPVPTGPVELDLLDVDG